uniref:apoptosis regulator BAX-like n=1 Tax=Ciona intestinalis TaxID=7719 RepID=UPI0000523B11|nr:apoptosis regulator BAX-like [Ciona intestinalis]|eukprot:XP_002123003.1 apoptosis regulator BAX-like [Ciona intestinalis]
MASNNTNQNTNMNNSAGVEDCNDGEGDGIAQTREEPKVPPAVRPRPMTAVGERRRPAAGRGEARDMGGASAYANNSRSNEPTNYESGDSAASTNNRNTNTYSGYDDQGPSTSSKCTGATSTQRRQRTYSQQVSREESRIGEQARFLLNMFIQDRAGVENSPVEPVVRNVCQADMSPQSAGFTDENLSDIAVTLRRIGDDMSRDIQLNRFIDQVPLKSTKDIFIKVCLQMFEDGNFNWGRIVALFYFAYRLIVRSLLSGLDSLPWIRELISWVVDFIVKKFAKWIISRGGWTMIKEWFGISSQTFGVLICVTLAIVGWAVFKKD